jgi:hypothetical protein
VTRSRKIMLEELQRRNYSAITTRNYLRVVADFAKHFGKSPDKLGLPGAIKRIVRVQNLSALERQQGDYMPAAYPILRKELLDYQNAWFEEKSLKALTATAARR